MAYSKKLCLAIHCFILLLSVEVMTIIPGANAKECTEGLVNVDVTCRRSEADQVCWIACQQKHGPSAEAWCHTVVPGLPAQVCMCTYPC